MIDAHAPQMPADTQMLSPRVREAYERELDEVRAAIGKEMRAIGFRGIATPKLSRLKRREEEITRRLAVDILEARERIAMAKIPIDQSLEIVMLPLLADVMVDLCCGVDSTLREAGVSETWFGAKVREMSRLALELVDSLVFGETCGLPDLVTNDETIVEAVKKKLLSYLKQHIRLK